MESESKKYTIEEIIKWSKNDELVLRPYYQRRKNIWSREGKSYFLDTLFRNLPIHKIFLREFVNKGIGIREVVDGQQRLRTILDFYDNNFRINNKKEFENSNKKYEEMNDDVKFNFLNYEMTVDILMNASDKDVRDLFLRLNKYSISLNKQELRNAKFHGEFKQFIDKQSENTASKLMKIGIISKNSYARMLELELISELIIAMIHGLQDKKKSIDFYYEEYDNSFYLANEMQSKYEEIFNHIYTNYYPYIKKTIFRRKAIFYSLFLVMYDIKHGLPRKNGPYNEKWNDEKIRIAIYKIDNVFKTQKLNSQYIDFIEACSRQTDNLHPRELRHDFILKAILNSED